MANSYFTLVPPPVIEVENRQRYLSHLWEDIRKREAELKRASKSTHDDVKLRVMFEWVDRVNKEIDDLRRRYRV